jgi:cyanophycinase-like exopeptidase
VTDGRLVLMGSGEIAPTMVPVHRAAMAAAGTSGVTVLDSPFGFQENVEVLTERLVEFFETSLVADVSVARLRSVGETAVARERALSQVRHSRFVFAGPGSPSYALKVWSAAGMADALREVLSAGGTVTLASAAAVTAGALSIPVYEIYKVGEDPFWLDGLDLVSGFGLDAVVVPHWNNTEGGNHDTSRCYIGERRLRILEADLERGILGIDEHTAATIDFGRGALEVAGRGSVTVRGGSERVLDTGTTVALEEVVTALGSPRTARVEAPRPPASSEGFVEALESGDVDGVIAAMLDAEGDPGRRAELRSMIVELGEAARAGLVDPRDVIAGFVDLLLSLRASARDQRRYDESDLIRDRLADLGVEVRDTATGQEWH